MIPVIHKSDTQLPEINKRIKLAWTKVDHIHSRMPVLISEQKGKTWTQTAEVLESPAK